MKPVYQTLERLVLCTLLLLLSVTVQAQTPNFPSTINYQGKLIENGRPFTGSATITFELINTTTNVILWTETQTVFVTNGLYSVVLGTQNPINSTLFSLASNTQLRISVNNNLLSPNVALTPVPYAHTAATVLPQSIRPINIQSGGQNKVLTTDATGRVVWIDQSALGSGGGATGTPTTYTALNGLSLTSTNSFRLGGSLVLPTTEIYLNGKDLHFFNLNDNGTPTPSSSNLKLELGNTAADLGGNISIKAQNSTSTASTAQGGNVIIESGKGINNGQVVLQPTDGHLILGDSTESSTNYSSFDLNGVIYLEDMGGTSINTGLGLYQRNGNLFWNGTALGLSSYSFLNGLNESAGQVELGGELIDNINLNYPGSESISFNIDLGSSNVDGGDIAMKAQNGSGSPMSEDSGGDVILEAGAFSTETTGGILELFGGSGTNGGSVYLKAGDGLDGSGGDIEIRGGDTEDTNATPTFSFNSGRLRFNAGNYRHSPSEISIQENIYMQDNGGKVLIGFSTLDDLTTNLDSSATLGSDLPPSPGSDRLEQTKLAVNGDIATNGFVFAQASINTSDQRLKKNILPLSNALSNVLALRGVSYDWRTEEFPTCNFDTDRQLGVLAQEVAQIYPEVVEVRPDGYLSVNYSALVPVLIEATKEQQNIIDEQQKETIQLKNKVQELEEKLNAVLQLLGDQSTKTLEAKTAE